jgi:alkylresorcinol/alkylpyrone synthase
MNPVPRAVLTDFRAVQLQPPTPQGALLSYTAWLLATARCAAERTESAERARSVLEDAQREVLRYGVSPRHIAARQFNAMPAEPAALGLAGEPPALPRGYDDIVHEPGGPGLDQRMRDAEAVALRVLHEWYGVRADPPEHLIHVTCSVYASPSPAQRLAAERGWLSTRVTHSYHMGCYGAFPAIRTAIGLLSPSVLNDGGQGGRVDLVHTEYLSTHFDTLLESPGELIDMTLFGDGFIGYSALSERAHAAAPRPGLRVLAHHEQLIPGSLDEMSWRLGPRLFEMRLTKNVPLAIRDVLVPFSRALLASAGLDFEREKHHLLFAVHPGGPKILDHARDVLGIDEAALRHARQVFSELGNMSSATVPYVLMRMLADPSVEPGRRILAAAFGPGLTATALLLEKI